MDCYTSALVVMIVVVQQQRRGPKCPAKLPITMEEIDSLSNMTATFPLFGVLGWRRRYVQNFQQ